MPNFYNPYQSNYYQPPQQMQVQTQPQIQNGGFVSVRNEAEARNYPIAIGTSVTFKDENAPYIYNKTMGFSQLDAPRFDKYRLVKEDAAEKPQDTQNETLDNSLIENTINDLKREIETIWAEIDVLKKKANNKSTSTAKKKEIVSDDSE